MASGQRSADIPVGGFRRLAVVRMKMLDWKARCISMDTEKYKMGWLIVAFDLPVGTKKQRKAATDFRKWLLDDGFQMVQFSVYVRSCVSFARQETHLDRLKKNLRPARLRTRRLAVRLGLPSSALS